MRRIQVRPTAASLLALMLAVCFMHESSSGQSMEKEQARQQAETQLQQMTPEQIDAKIGELGMTREEADAKARDLGIDLNSYLKQKGGKPAAKPSETTVGPAEKEASAQPPDQEVKEETKKEETKKEETTKSDSTLFGPGNLPYFGYEIFTKIPAAFEPTAIGPVDPEYLLGPEDVLRVTVWGQVEFQNELVVDREGRIFIPTIGQVLVSGLTLKQAYETLHRQMSRSYSGLLSQPPTVWLDVTLARLKPKRVFIMGEVPHPGGYTVSSYATVFNSLYSVGGPTINGSLREIRVLRGNKLITKIDLYDYLTGAEQTNDIRVQNEDIIFVPPRGNTVTLAGEVRRPAIYELKEGEGLKELLSFAGGALSTAYLERIQVDRIVPFAERKKGTIERKIIDVDFRGVMRQGEVFGLEDRDSVTVFSILEDRMNYVTIRGSVFRPGNYQLEHATTLRALVKAADGLLPRTYLPFAHLMRLNPDLLSKSIIQFSLQQLMEDPAYDRALRPRDEVIIYSMEAVEVKDRRVTIRGQVKKPGEYPYQDGMTLKDLVMLAEGYTEAAEVLEAEISRIIPEGVGGDSMAVILHPALPSKFVVDGANGRDGERSGDLRLQDGLFPLQHRDEVQVRPNPNYRLQQNVEIAGDIKYPGTYAISTRGERLSNLLARAGGPTKTSYFGGGQLVRNNKRLLVNFVQAYVNKNQLHDVIVKDGDAIFIPSRPYTVLVEGEVNKPGLLSFIEGESVSEYIERAGGLTDSVSYALLIKPTGETRRVNFGLFRSDPDVPEGSTISVLKEAPPPPEEKGESIATTIKDIFAIATSAATIAFLIYQTTK